jgi:membrane fusion protein, copper/silver efflux system
MTKNTLKVGALVVAVAAISAGGGYWLAQQRMATGAQANSSSGAEAGMQDSRKVLYWYDPMVPTQHFDKPGKSPFMDMQLVAKYADDISGNGNGDDATSIKIDPGVLQNLGVRSAKVERGNLAVPIDAVATVQLNDRQVAIVQARSGGFVERVYARAPGDVIPRGAPLVDLLMPEWAGAQGEFLAMLKTGDQALAQAARERLKLLGMPAKLIGRVEQIGQPQPVVTISTPIGGLIQTLDVRAGMTVSGGAALAKINGLDSVWLEAAIPEDRAGQIYPGKEMEAHFAAYPGTTFKGKVIAVLPETNADSRTLRVRVELPNRDGRLKPGMFAQVRLAAGGAEPVLLIPSEAVIRTGVRNVVLLALDEGRFQPVEVKLGQEAAGKVVVLDGLTEGQRIVASGQFLIDSEANLKGVLARMNGAAKETPAGAASAMAAPLHEAVGKVEAIKDGEITLSHGPVPSLGWGPMTMPFKLVRPDMAAALKPGDTVNFGFRESDRGYVIEQLGKSRGRP